MTTSNTTQLPPAILTFFGITGDLSKRKLLPALYYLAEDNMLPEAFKIVGVTRHGTTVDKVITDIQSSLKERKENFQQETLDKLRRIIVIVTMDILDPVEYARLKTRLDSIEDESKVCMNRLFYLAMPSEMFRPVTQLLDKNGLNTGCQHGKTESRLLIEKPLGYDLSSATSLIDNICQAFNEKQLYLIDHYLAKPAVQKLMAFKLDPNGPKPAWNKDNIKRIIIRADESIGIEGRAIFYEQMGALRDFLQSHLLQLLAIITMDKPANNSAEAIQTAKIEALNSVLPPQIDRIDITTVRGQYSGYRDEVNNPNSSIETFAAVKLEINSEQWSGVEIVLRTGKKLKAKATNIQLVFKVPGSNDEPNLIIHIEPGSEDSSRNSIKYRDDYEHVLVGAATGDKTLFATKEEILASWRIIEPILKSWAQNVPEISHYEQESDGPAAFNQLII